MKPNIKILFVLLISVFPLTAQNAFKIELQISKSTYFVGEPVQIGISISNISNITIHDEYLGQTDLKIIDQNGHDVQRGGIASTFWGPYKNKLAPNEEDYNVFVLNSYFGNDTPGLTIEKYYDPGNYTISVVFYPKNKIYDQVSDQISYQVIDPEGDELIVYNKYLEILKSESQQKLTKQNEEQTAISLRLLYETYPNSVYSPYILLHLGALYGIPLADGENALWATKELIEKHSYSVHAVYELNWLIKHMKSKSEKIEYVRMIKAKSEGTLMEKIYEEKIEEIGKK